MKTYDLLGVSTKYREMEEQPEGGGDWVKAEEALRLEKVNRDMRAHISLTLRKGLNDSNLFSEALFHADAMSDTDAVKLYRMLKRDAQRIMDAARIEGVG